MLLWLQEYIPHIVSTLALLAAILTSTHIILSRREPGSAVAWMGFTWLLPLVGSALYLILGINRIQRRAETLKHGIERFYTLPKVTPITNDALQQALPQDVLHLGALERLITKVVARPLLPGNNIKPLFNGDEAYPAMLHAIEHAQSSISLVSYIFDNDTAGIAFADALANAVSRGVDVRVLIDATGLRYSFPTIYRRLKKYNITAAKFLPTLLPPDFMAINLRNHRKMLVVDGHIGFTGGLNIRDAHDLSSNPKFPTRDIHFQVQGPVVAHLQEVFSDDWQFTTGECLRGEKWFPPIEPRGDAIARGIPDGPDEDFDKLRWTLLGAITCARESIRILTPYFVPDSNIIAALSLASMRGIKVDIIMPELNNLPFIQWASMGLIRPLLEHGCNLWFTPPPFDHGKLMIVDSHWLLLGSSNWDARSWRLNFEFNLECYDPTLAYTLAQWLDERIETARCLDMEHYENRSKFIQMRDGAFALFAPYL